VGFAENRNCQDMQGCWHLESVNLGFVGCVGVLVRGDLALKVS